MRRAQFALAAVVVGAIATVTPAGGSAEQTPTRGGTLYVARPAQTVETCLNPFACPIVDVDAFLSQVLEGAFETGPDLVQRPNLVSGFTVAKKPFTVTYRIRPEARWSDGRPVTAADFQFTHKQYRTLAQPSFDQRVLYRNIRRTWVLGPKTFRVEFIRPFARWRELYPIVLPRHVLAGHDLTKVWLDRVDDPDTGEPIGSGPFLTGRLEKGKQLALVRNPRYWGPHTAYLDRIVYRFTGGDDALGPMLRNEVGFAASAGVAILSADMAAQVRRLPGWRVVAWPAPLMEHFIFRVGSGGHPALKNQLVRRALAFGIDRVQIARVLLAEAGAQDRRPLDSTVFVPSERFYRPSWSGYRYAPDRARSLLEQAGCRRGSDGVYVCAGQRLSLRFVTTAGVPDRAAVLQLVQAQLRQAGIEAVLSFAPSRTLFGQVLPSGAYDAALFGWGTNGGGVTWPEGNCGDPENWAGFCSRLVTRDYKQVDVIVDPEQRARVLHALDAKLARAVPALPLVQSVQRVALRKDLRGFVPGGGIFNFPQTSEDWWLAQGR